MKLLSSSHLLIAAVLTVLTTDAQVSLRPLNESQQNFNCGGNAILECTIESYASMTWTKDSSQLATCSSSTCDINPFISADYNFTFNTTTGIFLMEILTVKVADNGSSFSCDNGFVPATLPLYVTVENDYSCVKNSKKINSNTTEVSVTTRCIQNSTAHNVKFEWWFKEVNNTSSEKRKRNESESETIYDSSVCIADPDCGVSGYSFITNSVNITNEESGKKYRIGVDVISGATLVNSVSFDLFFILNFPVSETTNCNTNCYKEIAIPYVIIFVIVTLVCIYEVKQYYKPKREAKHAKLKRQLADLEETLEVEQTIVKLRMGLNKSLSKDERKKVKRQLADLKETLEVKREKLQLAASKEFCLKDERNKLEKQLVVQKISSLEVEHINLEMQDVVEKLEALEVDFTEIERDRDDLGEYHVFVHYNTFERQLEALKANPTERIKLKGEHAALEAERIYLKGKLEDKNESHLEAERVRIEETLAALRKAEQLKLKRELVALNGPSLKVKLILVTLLCSLPFIGLLANGVLVLKRRKPDCQQSWKVLVPVLVLVVFSMTSEIFITLLWTVWCICQWHTFGLVFVDLISRGILCFLISVLYYKEIEETNGRIALPRMSIFRFIYSLLQCIVNILQSKNSRTSPMPDECNRTDQKSQNIKSTRETLQKNNFNLQKPKPLQMSSRVTSRSHLPALDAEIKPP